ncbi:hypothetical protein B0T16DRAFT_386166 [Cercophora newfieldiana]|uniref:Uncharacterized protein n=1 Tax=Cercophora newfieldiana TaxID=92897 RepID=A0AA40CZX1_9PEZI|nr:hypothetical protein B0T16DRAFT_386166 [Cercophora newfieldiana]
MAPAEEARPPHQGNGDEPSSANGTSASPSSSTRVSANWVGNNMAQVWHDFIIPRFLVPKCHGSSPLTDPSPDSDAHLAWRGIDTTPIPTLWHRVTRGRASRECLARVRRNSHQQQRQTAAALEANLTSLENKLDELLASFSAPLEEEETTDKAASPDTKLPPKDSDKKGDEGQKTNSETK